MKEIVDFTFKLTPEGIHLLRNRYTYRLILYSEIEKAFLRKGRSVKNWVIVLFIGVVFLILLIFSIYIIINSVLVSEKSVRFFNILGHGLIAIMVLGGMSAFSFYNGLKIIPVIDILVKGRVHKLRIEKNKKEVLGIIEFLESHGVYVAK
ncbi:hypothetical protein [Algoriphagus sp. AK58]|uniref:hypothetical protein n=1 Tax=Algoriphagus sp. AK58 TaxID=1406877 RepID=UPI00164F4120|nr:hypothetical protein [Algoriphagus sp. AK58]MBC6369161.1 hypothetical protein [Algoriphagus sp. AK58]